MNRELKFKIYDKNDTKCIIGPFAWNKLPQFLFPENFIVLQYTGLQDKNGKDIYEGDLLKWHEGDHELSEVVFQNGSFFVKGVNWGALWYVGDYNDSYEIVGNVFETPELLK